MRGFSTGITRKGSLFRISFARGQLKLVLDFFLGLAFPGQLRGVGGRKAGQFLLLTLGLDGQIIGPVLLLEAPAAQADQSGQQRQGGGGQEPPGGAFPLGPAAALGLPAEVIGQGRQFRGRFSSTGGHHGPQAQEVAEFSPQLDILGGFESPGGIRPGHGRLLKG